MGMTASAKRNEISTSDIFYDSFRVGQKHLSLKEEVACLNKPIYKNDWPTPYLRLNYNLGIIW